MRIVNCEQRSEQWEQLRATRPTASQFGRIVTPARGDLSKSHIDYACEIVAKTLGVWTEPPPSFWMEWGVEYEPHAISDYERRNECTVHRVGFVLPGNTDAFGGSPDGIVAGPDDSFLGLLEVKCPKPETLIRCHDERSYPLQYKPQIQGLLLITGLPWCDFFCFHPALEPYQERVAADLGYQAKMAIAIEQFLEELVRIKGCVQVGDYPRVAYVDEVLDD